MINQTGAMILHTVLMVVNKKAADVPKNDLFILPPQPNTMPLSMAVSYSPCDTVEGGACCYKSVGCFDVSSYPWLDIYRPESPPPQSPDIVRPKFCLFTRNNPDYNDCQELRYNETDTILKSHLVPAHRLYVIAHGFLEHGNQTWIHSLKMQLLKYSDCNVITVDWGGGSTPPYSQAVANKIVGVKTEFVHVIGHSLGAHLAGYIGNTLLTNYNLTLGRISGLDPAEPHFSRTDPVVRLDPSDAIFVDVLHTDAERFIKGGFGMVQPTGHLDFYPNSGNAQPGCDTIINQYVGKENSSIIAGVREHLGCDHVRSYQFYNESILSPCQFLAIECDSWENFRRGDCFGCRGPMNPTGWKCARLGFHSVKTAQKDAVERWGGDAQVVPQPDTVLLSLYTITGDKQPFCKSLYRVTLAVSDSQDSQHHRGDLGTLYLEILGIDGRTEEIQLFKKYEVFIPGTTLRQVIGGKQVGRVKSALLRYHYNVEFFNPLTWRLVKSMIHCRNLTIDNLEDDFSVTLCPEKEVLFSDEKVQLKPCSKPVLITT